MPVAKGRGQAMDGTGCWEGDYSTAGAGSPIHPVYPTMCFSSWHDRGGCWSSIGWWKAYNWVGGSGGRLFDSRGQIAQ